MVSKPWLLSGRSLRAAFLCSAILLSGCQSADFLATESPTHHGADSSATEPLAEGLGSIETTALANQTLMDLSKGKFQEASARINAALRLDITNSRLQFLNGLTYHLMAMKGDTTKLQLAEQGYRLALKFDPGNMLAKRHLARLFMGQGRFAEAEGLLASVAVYDKNDADALYDLAAAAYYNHDPQTAEAALKRLSAIDPDRAQTPEFLRARALVLASLNDPEAAQSDLVALQKITPNSADIASIERRLNNWSDFYTYDAGASKVRAVQAQYNTYGGDSDPYASSASDDPYASAEDSAGDNASADFSDGQMVVVDVVLIGTQSDLRESRGINLLNGLELQFGDPLAGTVAASFGVNKTKDLLDQTQSTNTKTITSLISIPAVTYSLNIANDADSQNQILAKPSLVAQAGQTSEFFSGSEITAAAVSGGAGDSVSVQKEVGVKLAVTPEFLPDDKIRLHIVAERTFLTDPSNSVVFQFRLDTSKTNINSTVTMAYDETLILGGLSERETSHTSDGVPILGEIPGINLLFNARANRKFERSILLLLTPRRPAYTNRSAESRQETEDSLSPFEQEMERLHRRYRDWFTPRPTFNEVIEGIQDRDFFQEFRTGDVKISALYDPADLSGQIAALRQHLAE